MDATLRKAAKRAVEDAKRDALWGRKVNSGRLIALIEKMVEDEKTEVQ